MYSRGPGEFSACSDNARRCLGVRRPRLEATKMLLQNYYQLVKLMLHVLMVNLLEFEVNSAKLIRLKFNHIGSFSIALNLIVVNVIISAKILT